MQQQIFDLLLEQEEISWRNILYDLVKTEQMDPWDIDIALLTKKYILLVKEMQQHDLKISGKVLLAAAILLKIKSTHLIENDISNLDKLINQTSLEEEETIFEELTEELRNKREQKYHLIPKNPQPRSRKVSIHDLVEALQRALATKKKILAQQRPVRFSYPKRKIDIMEVIRDLYHKIVYYTNKEQESRLTFTKLLPPKAGKKEKAYTFIPLLHLEHQQKIETEQGTPFEEIYVKLLPKTKAQ